MELLHLSICLVWAAFALSSTKAHSGNLFVYDEVGYFQVVENDIADMDVVGSDPWCASTTAGWAPNITMGVIRQGDNVLLGREGLYKYDAYSKSIRDHHDRVVMEVFGDHLLYNIYGFEDCVVRCRGKVGGGSVLGLQGEGQVDEVGLIEHGEVVTDVFIRSGDLVACDRKVGSYDAMANYATLWAPAEYGNGDELWELEVTDGGQVVLISISKDFDPVDLMGDVLAGSVLGLLPMER